MSVYPRLCECCNPPKLCKTRSIYSYHLNYSKTAQIEKEMKKSNQKVKSEINEPVLKKAKIEDNETEEIIWLNSKLDLFLKLVVKNHGSTDLLESNLSVEEEDMKDDFKIKISELCFKVIAKWDQTQVSHAQETFTMEDIRV